MVMTNIATAIEHGHSAIQFVELPLLTMVDLSILFCKRLPEDTQCHKHREKPNLGMESPSKCWEMVVSPRIIYQEVYSLLDKLYIQLLNKS